MAEMTREQLQGAVMALERRLFSVESTDYLLNEYRCKLAAMPTATWTAREWSMREAIKRAWNADSLDESNEALRPIIQNGDLCRTTEALPPSPDLRAALVEARAAINKCAIDRHCKSNCVCEKRSHLRTALARIDKVLEEVKK